MAARQLTPEQRAAKRKSNREYMRRSRQKDAGEYMRQWRAANAARRREYMREWRLSRGEEEKVQRREYAVAHREQINLTSRERHRANALKRRNQMRDWRKAHPAEALALVRNRRARIRTAPGRHTAADVARLYETQHGVCAGCGAVLVAKGRGKYHVDHIMPIALGGSNWPENLQLLCPPCNLSKGVQHPDAWACERLSA
jgi:5-methylcytosine-specific restriction endonuclease McrA